MSPTKDEHDPTKPEPEHPPSKDEAPPAGSGRGALVAFVVALGGMALLLLRLLLDLLGGLFGR